MFLFNPSKPSSVKGKEQAILVYEVIWEGGDGGGGTTGGGVGTGT